MCSSLGPARRIGPTALGFASLRPAAPDRPWTDSDLQLTFSLKIQAAAQHMITPVEIADALNEIAVSRGWPALTFYGRPDEAPLI
ncbi:hypothetical protein ACW4TU_39175 [Streptomyces sp. QTS52]